MYFTIEKENEAPLQKKRWVSQSLKNSFKSATEKKYKK